MRERLIFFISFLISGHFCFGQLELSGTYQGRNIYVQNPAADSGNGHCTKRVIVNGKECAFEKTDVFVIFLDSFHFKFGDHVDIEIFHGDNCMPKVLNNDINPRLSLRFSSMTIDKEGTLNWTAVGDTGKLPYIIEQYRWNKWIKIGEVGIQKEPGEHSYSFKLSFYSGENRFRIKRYESDNIVQTSDPIKYFSDSPAPTYKINFKTKQIIFSSATMYEVYDSKGNILKKGFGTVIDVRELESDQYYLNYDNTSTDFYL